MKGYVLIIRIPADYQNKSMCRTSGSYQPVWTERADHKDRYIENMSEISEGVRVTHCQTTY